MSDQPDHSQPDFLPPAPDGAHDAPSGGFVPPDGGAGLPSAASEGYGQAGAAFGAPAGGGGPPGRTPGKATASLTLGIAGLLICPFVCSVLAIVLGQQAKAEIARDPSLGGRGTAQAGFVTGVVGAAFGALGVVLIVAGAIKV